MTTFPKKKQCDRCGAMLPASKLFHIPWTGDCLCKECIDKDCSIQQMLVEICSINHDRLRHGLGTQTDLPDGMDMLAYILEPDEK